MKNDRLSESSATLPFPSAAHPTAAEDPRPPIDGVFFDVSGVLYDDTQWRRWLLQLLSHMGLHTHFTPFFRVWDREYRDDVAWERIPYWQAMGHFLQSAGLSRSQVEEVEAAARSRFHKFEANIRPFPHIQKALVRLAARHVLLGIACSEPLSADQLDSKLSRLHLRDAFQSVHSPRDLPDRQDAEDSLQAILEASHLPASRTAYVGRDSRQLAAARNLGIYTIAFNPEADATADTILEQFDQLPELIQSQTCPLLAAG